MSGNTGSIGFEHVGIATALGEKSPYRAKSTRGITLGKKSTSKRYSKTFSERSPGATRHIFWEASF